MHFVVDTYDFCPITGANLAAKICAAQNARGGYPTGAWEEARENGSIDFQFSS